MKTVIILTSLLAAASAQAAMPFTISGDKIRAIFQSQQLWQKLGGAVETIVFKGHSGNTSKFAITTTESVPVVGNDGVTQFKPTPCLVVADVTDTGDGLVPKWEVTNVDFAACPKTSGR